MQVPHDHRGGRLRRQCGGIADDTVNLPEPGLRLGGPRFGIRGVASGSVQNDTLRTSSANPDYPFALLLSIPRHLPTCSTNMWPVIP